MITISGEKNKLIKQLINRLKAGCVNTKFLKV